jgi:hypothetical protein
LRVVDVRAISFMMENGRDYAMDMNIEFALKVFYS